MEQVSLVPILVWVAALVCWGVSVWWGPRPILVTDFLTPMAVLALLLVAVRRPQPKSPDTLALKAELEVARRAMRSYRDALDKFVKE